MAQSVNSPYKQDHGKDVYEHGPVVSTMEARQGVISGRVRLILISSLGLCLIAFVILMAVKMS